MSQHEFFLTNSLSKVLPSRRPEQMVEGARLSAWPGSRAAVQLVYRGGAASDLDMPREFAHIQVSGAPCEAKLYAVELVPSDFTVYDGFDDDFITKEPGLFPDLLTPLDSPYVRLIPHQYRSVWISFELADSTPAGDYAVRISVRAPAKRFNNRGGVEYPGEGEAREYNFLFTLSVGCVKLPPSKLIHTEWFHVDCLASWYKVSPFGEEHWRLVENYMRDAVARQGVNALLTPVFTPPTDTAPGHYRPTVQLVDVYLDDGRYTFGFEKLRRWLELCRRFGVEYIEVPQFFTQWGAHATPQVVANVGGEDRRIFGWDVPAGSKDYRAFLSTLLPALRREFRAGGYDDSHVIYHISDEPGANQLEAFMAAKRQVQDLVKGSPIIDSYSAMDLAEHDDIYWPEVSTDLAQPLLDAGVKDICVFYCCQQGRGSPNRFFAMESARNRIMGVLLYLQGYRGFLHWGYNFWYSAYSYKLIDPFRVTHSDYGFPSGDAYLVYPGEDGFPLGSVRAEVQYEALMDLRALELLESLAGRDEVEELIYSESSVRPMNMDVYPHGADYLLKLREKVADAINKHLGDVK